MIFAEPSQPTAYHTKNRLELYYYTLKPLKSWKTSLIMFFPIVEQYRGHLPVLTPCICCSQIWSDSDWTLIGITDRPKQLTTLAAKKLVSFLAHERLTSAETRISRQSYSQSGRNEPMNEYAFTTCRMLQLSSMPLKYNFPSIKIIWQRNNEIAK